MPTILVLGGTRSGKTAYAQARALAAAEGRTTPTMIVTAQALDDEMTDRIARHRQDRGDGWRTLEAPLNLASVLEALSVSDVAVVDCLTLWLSNLMGEGRDIEAETAALAQAVARCPAALWVVSNEVGWGIVPDNPLARQFRDHAGRLHQRLAAEADGVVVVVAGLPMMLKAEL